MIGGGGYGDRKEGLLQMAHQGHIADSSTTHDDLPGPPIDLNMAADAFRRGPGHEARQCRKQVFQVTSPVPEFQRLHEAGTKLFPPCALGRRAMEVGVQKELLQDEEAHASALSDATARVVGLRSLGDAGSQQVQGHVARTGVERTAALQVLLNHGDVGDAPDVEADGPGAFSEQKPIEKRDQRSAFSTRGDVPSAEVPHCHHTGAFRDHVDVPDLEGRRLQALGIREMANGLSVAADDVHVADGKTSSSSGGACGFGKALSDLLVQSGQMLKFDVRRLLQGQTQGPGIGHACTAEDLVGLMESPAGDPNAKGVHSIRGRPAIDSDHHTAGLPGKTEDAVHAPQQYPLHECRDMVAQPFGSGRRATSGQPMNNILIVDDESSIRSAVRMILKYEKFACSEAGRADEALKLLDKESVDLVLCDVKMPGMDGLELLTKLKKLQPKLPVVMISGHGTLETAVEATRRGAYDFLEKPLDRDRLLLTIRNALGQGSLAQENAKLRETIADRFRLQGECGAMQELRKTIRRVGDTDARVLITGENGTGKELVARNLHIQSSRADRPWVAVNCAAIPSELIESELFGHEKGAFTGAEARKIGKFEQAHGGTLFLDEIGDMPASAQAKVLRVLQEDQVQRVGGSDVIPIEVRVVAATNKDLEKEVAEGNFREDLFYRLNVIPLVVPPLRERGDDVIELFQEFLETACKKYDRPPMMIQPDVHNWLRSQSWPGNVRELLNLSERVALLVSDEELAADALQNLGKKEGAALGTEGALFEIESFEVFKETAERLYLHRKLSENGWNVKRTAESLGMQRSNMYKKIDRYGLKSPGKE